MIDERTPEQIEEDAVTTRYSRTEASFVRLTIESREELERTIKQLRLAPAESVQHDLASSVRKVCAEAVRLHQELVDVRVAIGGTTKQRDEARALLGAEAEAELPPFIQNRGLAERLKAEVKRLELGDRLDAVCNTIDQVLLG